MAFPPILNLGEHPHVDVDVACYEETRSVNTCVSRNIPSAYMNVVGFVSKTDDPVVRPLSDFRACFSSDKFEELKLGCTDTSGSFEVTKPDGTVIPNRSCDWVAQYPFRYDFVGAPENCPVTCNTCCSDASESFEVTKPDGTVIPNRRCDWVAQYPFRCDFDGAQENCPDTCNTCLS